MLIIFQTPLHLALHCNYQELAKILARGGARCTEDEKTILGKTYTDFVASFEQNSSSPSVKPATATLKSSSDSLKAPVTPERTESFGANKIIRTNSPKSKQKLSSLDDFFELTDFTPLESSSDSQTQDFFRSEESKDFGFDSLQKDFESNEKAKEERSKELRDQLNQLEEQVAALRKENAVFQALLQEKDLLAQQNEQMINKKEAELLEKDLVVLQKDQELKILQEKEAEIFQSLQSKISIIQQGEAEMAQLRAKLPLIQQQQEEIHKLRAELQRKDSLIQKLQQNSRPLDVEDLQVMKARQEEMQIQLWKMKKIIAQQIKNLATVKMISKIAHGCDGIVFNCSAEELGVESIAVKILFNMGINTSKVKNSFANEYEILKLLPFHVNIIPILNEFLDRPPPEFLEHFPPDLKQLVAHDIDGKLRTTTCILMPIFESFEVFLKREFSRLSLKDKFGFISDIINGVEFLFNHDVVHRDLKLNNLLINTSGRIIISDFGCSTQLAPDKTIYIAPGESIGGNIMHLAPEIRKINPNISRNSTLVDYAKQPPFELGILAHEIYFGKLPLQNQFAEDMNEDYFLGMCSDPSHQLPVFFDWLKGLLFANPTNRLSLRAAVDNFKIVQSKI